MGQVLDSIIKHEFIEVPEIVSTQFVSDAFDISGVEEAFTVSLTYDNGGSVNMELFMDISIDGTNFVPIDSPQNIIDNTGTHMWDIGGSGATFCRIRIEVNSGSIDVQNITLSGKRRH
jgi:hypothetical protein